MANKKFEIYNKKQNGKYSGINKIYPDIPVLSITKTWLRFNDVSETKLQLKKGSEILFSKSDNEVYIADVTETYISGFRLNHVANTKNLVVNSKLLISRMNLEGGIYLIDKEAIFDKDTKIDWYKLTLQAKLF
jgi:hypothetical protein